MCHDEVPSFNIMDPGFNERYVQVPHSSYFPVHPQTRNSFVRTASPFVHPRRLRPRFCTVFPCLPLAWFGLQALARASKGEADSKDEGRRRSPGERP